MRLNEKITEELYLMKNNKIENEVKAELIKTYLFELSVNTKKELQIQESPLFKSSKILNFFVGNPTENWTPVTALRRQSPNH